MRRTVGCRGSLFTHLYAATEPGHSHVSWSGGGAGAAGAVSARSSAFGDRGSDQARHAAAPDRKGECENRWSESPLCALATAAAAAAATNLLWHTQFAGVNVLVLP